MFCRSRKLVSAVGLGAVGILSGGYFFSKKYFSPKKAILYPTGLVLPQLSHQASFNALNVIYQRVHNTALDPKTSIAFVLGIDEKFSRGEIDAAEFIQTIREQVLKAKKEDVSDKEIISAWNAMLGNWDDDLRASVKSIRDTVHHEGIQSIPYSRTNILHTLELDKLFGENKVATTCVEKTSVEDMIEKIIKQKSLSHVCAVLPETSKSPFSSVAKRDDAAKDTVRKTLENLQGVKVDIVFHQIGSPFKKSYDQCIARLQSNQLAQPASDLRATR